MNSMSDDLKEYLSKSQPSMLFMSDDLSMEEFFKTQYPGYTRIELKNPFNSQLPISEVTLEEAGETIEVPLVKVVSMERNVTLFRFGVYHPKKLLFYQRRG